MRFAPLLRVLLPALVIALSVLFLLHCGGSSASLTPIEPPCPDSDGDGFEDADCGGTDCDDKDAAVHPDAVEICDDGLDNDCDDKVDGLDPDCWGCPDADGDGFEDQACGGTDCDDTDPAVNPAADEDCGDGVDNDCDGLIDAQDPECAGCPDADGDGFEDEACGGTDCDDLDATIYPGAPEICDNGIDEDCSGFDWTPCPDTQVLVSAGPGTGILSFLVAVDYDESFVSFTGDFTATGIAAGFQCIPDDDGDVVAVACLGGGAPVDGPGALVSFRFSSTGGLPDAGDFDVVACQFADVTDTPIPGIQCGMSLP